VTSKDNDYGAQKTIAAHTCNGFCPICWDMGRQESEEAGPAIIIAFGLCAFSGAVIGLIAGWIIF